MFTYDMHLLLIILCSMQLLGNKSTMIWRESTGKIDELRSTNKAFIGLHNNTIYVLGGVGSGNVLITFPLELTWIQSNTTSNNFGYQWAQSSVQINQQIWMLPHGQMKLNVFDMNQEKIIEHVAFNGTATQSRCITNYHQYVLVVGGWNGNDYLAEFNIYNISNQEWTVGLSIHINRFSHSCNVVGDTLYVIGGFNGYYLDSVEYSSFDGLTGTFNGWNTMISTLSTGKRTHRSVVFERDIFVLGGYNGQQALDRIDIIDTWTKTISFPDTNHLVYAKYMHSAIINNNIIYCFAGSPTTNNEYYQYAVINSLSPTTSPTNSPTISPTIPPTSSPTVAPTISPTLSPTRYPTFSPTRYPTNSPTISPTRYPTKTSEYNETLQVFFTIDNLTESNKVIIKNTQDIQMNIIPLIETSFVDIIVGDTHLEYKQFEIIPVKLHYINYRQYPYSYQLSIDSTLNYNSEQVKNIINTISNNDQFISNTQDLLRIFYNYQYVTFAVKIIDPTFAVKIIDYVFCSILSFIGMMSVISLFAFMYNKKQGTKTDDANWMILIFVASQIADFLSDILLSKEITNRFGTTENEQSLLLHISGLGSIVFIVIPYIFNIYVTVKIDQYIKDNKIAIMHFKNYRVVFVVV
eukprot:85130_1